MCAHSLVLKGNTFRIILFKLLLSPFLCDRSHEAVGGARERVGCHLIADEDAKSASVDLGD